MRWRQPETKRTKTVCTYCGVGCSFEMWTRALALLIGALKTFGEGLEREVDKPISAFSGKPTER